MRKNFKKLRIKLSQVNRRKIRTIVTTSFNSDTYHKRIIEVASLNCGLSCKILLKQLQ